MRGGCDLKPNKEMLGTDDWLAREIARESKISAWDLDEGKELRRKHEEKCDAREEASKHRSFHQATQHQMLLGLAQMKQIQFGARQTVQQAGAS